jgi:alkylmercury lyase
VDEPRREASTKTDCRCDGRSVEESSCSTPLGVSRSGRALRDAGFHSVLAGRAVPLADLAAMVGASETAGEELAARGLIVLDDARRIVGAHGLSLVEARQHRLTIRGRTFWTWCAIDAVGIAAALREDALAETTCHGCGVAVQMRFARGVMAEASHPNARLWNARHVRGRSMAGGTCGLMNLFRTPEHLASWQSANHDEPGDAIDLDQAMELGHSWWGALR